MILSFLVILAILVIAHELGHFATAKAFGVKVEEFGVGFPPRLLSFKRGETRYSLNAIPLGGFTKMAGEIDPKEPRSLASKNGGVRALILSAGSLMNALLPILLFSIAFMVPHNVVVGQIVVDKVASDSPAAIAGIESGDTIISMNNKILNSTSDLSRETQLNLGKEVTLTTQRNGATTTETVKITPRWKPPEGQGALGILVATVNPAIVSQREPFWRAIPLGVKECIETYILFKNGILSLFIGTATFQVGGPVAIAQITGEVAKAGISPLLEFASFLSINLAIINMFPLPALDGGRIVFVLLEWIRRGKRVSPKTEGLIHAIGFALLIAAMLAVTFQDILRIINGQSFIP